MEIKKLETIEDFETIKKDDVLVCEFHRDVYKGNKRTRFATYNVVENKSSYTEIILQVKNNVYFNYTMYLKGTSNLKDVALLTQSK